MIYVLTDWNLVTCCLFTYLLIWVYCQTVMMSSWQWCHHGNTYSCIITCLLSIC